ncbi:hypothetical protein [Desulfatitalea alkaliphila]|uniref:Uncharacterized protein n=1 Tax=Desulfatitalea alkaliphila TaxID=2929485 RepID=A0AA41R4W2_9BACT|nr:hypothetical protein [Desulfatitalea alkaliphila]MCJ8500846.1 hypothetical protein [Desulfatitalea alkaliphila]
MKLHADIRIGGKQYAKGDTVPWYFIYPFFMVHMLAFGASGFYMAYADKGPDLSFLYMHGGIAIFVYTIFYIVIFGRDEVKWMFINSALGLFGIWVQIDWLLAVFGKNVADYPMERHVIPFFYFVLYTFLLRNATLDLTDAREDPRKKKFVENAYVIISVTVYVASYFLTGR